MAEDIPKPELCDRYGELYTGLVADVLDDHGYEDQTIGSGIEPLERGMRAAGIAYPAVGRANRSVDPDVQARRFLRMIEEAPPESMLLLDANDPVASHIGELTTTVLHNNGCRGAVIKGAARDTAAIVEQGFPVFTDRRTPLDALPRWELVEWGETAVVGDVTVAPGDVVLADADGVVVVPEGIRGEVLADAEAERETESELRAAIEDGASAIDAYEEYGTF
jgi:regulator of RNase E activity RraA